MPVLTENELKKRLKSDEPDRLYLIYGEENYLKSHYVERIAKNAVKKEFEAFNLHKLEGKGLDLYTLSDIIEAYPMMGGFNCVIVHDLPIDALSKDDTERLSEIISDLPETTILILWMDHIEVSAKKSARWRSFIKEAAKYGCVAEMKKRSRGELIKLVRSGAAKRGCAILPDKADRLISIVGDDLTNLLNELEKVCAFTGGGEIGNSDIDAVAVKTVDAAVFDLAKAIAAGDASRAFGILSDLFIQKTEPVMIMGALISSYVDMYRIKICRQSGGRAEDVSSVFNYKNKEFRLRIAASQSAPLSAGQLRDCLDELYSADRLLKGSGLDEKIILEKCVARLIAKRAVS
ncbi:MAG: DNA polymerase III subunit delta [Clostridiales bacterium]|nr:DNA polymerase III subunit delta [Clostridiales bacterium]